MDHIIYHDSPLADFLEGEGSADAHLPSLKSSQLDRTDRISSSDCLVDYAPRNLPVSLGRRLKPPLQITVPRRVPLSSIRKACSRILYTSLDESENAKFQEHFRYLIVASRLLSEHFAHVAPRPAHSSTPESDVPVNEAKSVASTVTGTLITASVAFLLAWVIQLAKSGKTAAFAKSPAPHIHCLVICGLVIFWTYGRRQWLKSLRKNAVASASTMVTNLDALEMSLSSALSLIQEVELVSRGYQLTPLPPICRMEEKSSSRRCLRIRRCLYSTFEETIPLFIESCRSLEDMISRADLEKYLDFYEIDHADIKEAYGRLSEMESEDRESLKALRLSYCRLALLRKLYLSLLLSLRTNGQQSDIVPWRKAVMSMRILAETTRECAERLNELLTADEVPANSNSPVVSKAQHGAERDRVRGQIRKLGILSSGVRGLQAKLQIFREETTKSLEESGDLTDMGTTLLAQYDSIGADLRALVQAWESGRTSLALNIDRHERRISQASSTSGLRSPVPSLGGLTAVDETSYRQGVGGESPADALRALNGEFATALEGMSYSGSQSDEEVFEAMALPRQPQSLTRTERLVKMQEERAKLATVKEQREASLGMIRELESVINIKGSKRTFMGTSRLASN